MLQAPPSPALSSPVSATSFVAAMAKAATQVTVVSTDGAAGRCGVTVSAFASVSAEPPMVLVCIRQASPARAVIEANGVFCVNLLHDSQKDIADCFAGRPETGAAYDFSCAHWDAAATGAPTLRGALAQFDCTLEHGYRAGTHQIFLGHVMAVMHCERAALAFSNRDYRALRALDPHCDRNFPS